LQLVGELKDGGWGHAISLIAKHASRAISICIPVQIWPRQIEEAAGKLALIVQTKSATIHLHNKRPARVPFSETVVQNPEPTTQYPVSTIQYPIYSTSNPRTKSNWQIILIHVVGD